MHLLTWPSPGSSLAGTVCHVRSAVHQLHIPKLVTVVPAESPLVYFGISEVTEPMFLAHVLMPVQSYVPLTVKRTKGM